MLCSSVAMYECFGEIFCLYRRDRRALFFLFNNILGVFLISHVVMLSTTFFSSAWSLPSACLRVLRQLSALWIMTESEAAGIVTVWRELNIYSFRGNSNASHDRHCAFKVEVKIGLTRTPEIRIETWRKQVRNFPHNIKILPRLLIFCLTISELARFVGKN